MHSVFLFDLSKLDYRLPKKLLSTCIGYGRQLTHILVTSLAQTGHFGRTVLPCTSKALGLGVVLVLSL